jgi:hypothetical protein
MRLALEQIRRWLASKRRSEGVFGAKNKNTPGTFSRPRNTQSPSSVRCQAAMKTSKPESAATETRWPRCAEERQPLRIVAMEMA